jgi:choline dehydrogenase-like flavoprotein
MKFIDFQELEDNARLEVDLCIVGSGPVSLTIANEFARTNLQVLVLESGGLAEESNTQSLYEIQNTGVPFPLDHQTRQRLRIFGGTSRIWTGRCAPFKNADFDSRPWVNHSGWPLTRAQLDPYFERAGVYLGLGPHCYDESLWARFKVPRPTPALDEQLIEPIFWQFSTGRTSGRSADFSQDLEFPTTPNLKVLLHANVTHINTNESLNKFESVEIRTLNGKVGQIRARALVLGCGGIENARLLLASNRQAPAGLGNQHDLVGRYLMDHPLCVVGRFEPEHAGRVLDRFGHYWLDENGKRHVYLHGMALSRAIQSKDHLLQCHTFIDGLQPASDDPWIALRRFRSALKSRKLGKEAAYDIGLLLTHSLELGRGVYRRLVKHRPQLTRGSQIGLYCMLEQAPDPESRIFLSHDRKDALGMPLSVINWKIGELERRTARRMARLSLQELSRLKLPVPSLCDWLDNELARPPMFESMAHPTGTTRLALDPKQGVVDANLQVHDVHGLFIVGTSVFPTSGAVNPTLMALTMALRLADWLKSSDFKS